MTLQRGRAETLETPLPTTMNAAVIDAVGADAVFRAADVSLPIPVSSEVLVRVRAASANPIDGSTLEGGGVSGSIPSFPCVLGSDFSGTVVRTPYAAHPLRVGDEVYGVLTLPRGSGSFAGYAAVPSLQLAKAPSRLSLIEAAAVPLAALTAWGMVVEVGKAHEGQHVLVLGASTGVGHFAVQLAHYFGAHVTAVADPECLGWVRELGADRVLGECTDLAEFAQDLDVVLDVTGDESGERARGALRALRAGGLLVTSTPEALPRVIDECGMAGVRATDFRAVPDGSTLAVISRLIDSGDLAVHVEKVYPLSRVDEAVGLARTGAVRGKLVVEVSDFRG